MKATSVAVVTAIPTAALVVRDSIAPAEKDSFWYIYTFLMANNHTFLIAFIVTSGHFCHAP